MAASKLTQTQQQALTAVYRLLLERGRERLADAARNAPDGRNAKKGEDAHDEQK